MCSSTWIRVLQAVSSVLLHRLTFISINRHQNYQNVFVDYVHLHGSHNHRIFLKSWCYLPPNSKYNLRQNRKPIDHGLWSVIYMIRASKQWIIHTVVEHDYVIIIINIQVWAIWPVPSPELQLLSPSLLRSPNCSLSLWVVEVWFQGDSVLWHSLYVCEPVPSVFIYLV